MGFSFKNRWAVLTGASAGIGKAMAKELAKQGCNLFLVARREQLLQDLAVGLMAEYKVDIKWLALDLTEEDAAETLTEHVCRYPISMVINNAGFAVAGQFEGARWEKIQSMIDLNIRFTTKFTLCMLDHLKKQPDGARVLNVGSITGYQGVPNMVTYAASKAYVNNFSEGLNWELRGSNVVISCLEPGQTASEFFEVAGVADATMAKYGLLTCEGVAKQGLKAMKSGRTRLVAGWVNKALVFSLRLFPRTAVRIVIRRLFADMAH